MENTAAIEKNPEIQDKLELINQLNNEINELKESIESMENYDPQSEEFIQFCVSHSQKTILELQNLLQKEEEEVDAQIEIIKQETTQLSDEFNRSILLEKEKAEKILENIVQQIKQMDQQPEAPVLQVSEPEVPVLQVPLQAEEVTESSDQELDRLVEELKARKREVTNEKSKTDSPIENEVDGFWSEIPQIYEEIEKDPEKTSDTEDTTVETTPVDSTPDETSRYNFIIGKVAGENLFDKSGKLIIAQDEIISEEVVLNAESEGKLIELIINMKLQ